MKFRLKATDCTLDDALRVYVDQKIVAVARKFLSGGGLLDSAIVDIEIGRFTKHHRKGTIWRAEANLSLPGAFLRAESSAEDVRSAIDLLKEELEVELRKYKTKKIEKIRRGGRKAKQKFIMNE